MVRRSTFAYCNYQKAIVSFFSALMVSIFSFAQNPIVTENALTGNPSSEWDIFGAGNLSIQGFATDISVNKGVTVRFKINVTGAVSYSIRIYRIGYYQGNGARLVANLGSFTGTVQPSPTTNSGTGLVDCGNWSESANWAVPTTAVSGVYFAKLTRSDNNGSSHITFIVRDDAGNSPVLFKTSDATWQAYNPYGGNSLYVGTTSFPGGHAAKVSYNRPFLTRNGGGGGGGSEDWFFNAEYPMVRFLERNGYNVSYTTDVDMDRDASVITPSIHKVILSVGHDEYWSAAERTKFENARNAGVHLAFFSGNEVYWKTRWENNNRTLVCYKEGNVGEIVCGNKCDNTSPVWTGLWRTGEAYDAGLPENALSGQVSWVGSTGSIQVPASYKKLRFWRNTSIASANTTTTFPNGTLGYEWDYEQPQYVSSNPPGRIIMSSTTISGKTHKLSLYRHASGALVFGAGTVQWSWGLDNEHDLGDNAANTAMQQATVNLFADMGVQPATLQSGLTTATQSADGTLPSSSITSPSNGASFPSGSTITISGNATDGGGGVVAAVEVSVDGGNTWSAANMSAADISVTWSYSWATTSNGTFNIKSRGVDDSGNKGNGGAGINVNVGAADNTPPTVSSVSPVNGATGVSVNTTVTANFNEVINSSTVTGTTFQLRDAGNNLVSANISTSSNQVSLIPTAALTGSTVYTVMIIGGASGVKDLAGNALVNNYSWSFTTAGIDNTPPAVNSVSPVSGATGVSINTTVVANFNEVINGSTVTGTTFQLRDAGNNVVSASVSTSSNQITLTTSSALTASTVYTATIQGGTSGVKDLAGNALVNNYSWTFTTGSIDNTAPTVTSVSPVNGATGVSINTTVTANFNEVINSSTVTGTTFQLKDAGNNILAASVSTSSNQINLILSSALVNSATYTATIKGGVSGVKDLAGNALVNDYSWTFTTIVNSGGTSYTIFQSTNSPQEALANDGQGPGIGMVVGLKFRSTQNGFITGIRYYKGAGSTGTRTGHLWSRTGTQLAAATFTGGTASGWQQVLLSSPVAITAGTTYVVTYFSSSGDYAYTDGYLTQAIVNGPLRALANGEDGPNGLYRYSATAAFPTIGYQSSNYWVDVVFTTGGGGGGGSSPVVTTQPSAQTVCAGNNVSFNSAASGSPAPAVQWQSSTNGTTWTNIIGATNSTLTFAATTGDNNKQYRAVWTNSGGSVNSNPGTLTVITIPGTPTVSVVNNCGNSVLTAGSFTGTLLWSNGATISPIIITPAGTYTVTQRVNGCTSAPGSGIAAPKTIPSAPTVTVVNNCSNSALTAGALPGSLLMWSTGETTQTITVPAGPYTVTQTANGCLSATGTGTAAPKAIPSAPTVAVVNNCGNSVLTAGSVSGSFLLWSTGETTASIMVTTAGPYTVTQTVNGCTSAPGTGTAAPANSSVATPTVNVVNNCGNSVLTAGSVNGSLLLWSTGETTTSIMVTTAETYTVTQRVSGCTSAPGIGITAPKTIPSAPTVTVFNNCSNSVLTAGSLPGSLLMWSTGETTQTITVPAGTYTVTQTANGCPSVTGTGTAAPKAIPSAPTVGVVNNCGNSVLTAGSVVSGSLLLWSTGETTTSIMVTTSETYTVTQTVNGCISTPGIGTAAPLATSVATPAVDVVNNCGNSVLTAGSFTGSLLWSNDATTSAITVTTGGTYTVTQTVNGCTSAAGIGIAAPKAIPALSGNLTATATSGTAFTYTAASTTAGTTFAWSRAAITGISNAAANGTGNISETLVNTTSSPVNVTYVYTLTANGCTNTQNVVVTVNPVQTGNCVINGSITSSFNNTAIPAGRYIWFNSVFDRNSFTGVTGPVTFNVSNSKITFTANSQQYTLNVPNSRIRFDAAVTSASTQFINNVWETAVPRTYTSYVFMGGLSYLVPANLPGNITNIKWTADIGIDKTGITISWKWAAAVYTSFAGHSGLNIKPIGGITQNPYPNFDKAGTPENFKAFVVAGAKGTGGTNYTGNYSGTSTATCVVTTGQRSSVQPPTAPQSLKKQIPELSIEKFSKGKLEVNVMPNPSNTFFNLVIRGNNKNPVRVRVIDIFGRVVERHEKITSDNILQLGQTLVSGSYFVEVIQDDQRKFLKIIKVN